jgi:Mor family transcriptional regulator
VHLKIVAGFTGDNYGELGKEYALAPLEIFLILKIYKHRLLKSIHSSDTGSV